MDTLALLRRCTAAEKRGTILHWSIGQLSWMFMDFRVQSVLGHPGITFQHLPPEFANRREMKPEFQKLFLRKLQTICQNLSWFLEIKHVWSSVHQKAWLFLTPRYKRSFWNWLVAASMRSTSSVLRVFLFETSESMLISGPSGCAWSVHWCFPQAGVYGDRVGRGLRHLLVMECKNEAS